MSDRNQFSKLRYESDLALNPTITQRELAKKLNISNTVIGKLEKHGCDSSCVSTIKAYKKGFLENMNEDISYEYLMGDTETKSPEYAELGKILPFDDSFYDNLKKLTSLDYRNCYIKTLLQALVHDPEGAFRILSTIFKTLYSINYIQREEECSESAKLRLMNVQEDYMIHSITEYLKVSVLPLLQKSFELEEQFLAEDSEDTRIMLQELEDEHCPHIVATPLSPIEADMDHPII